MNKLPFKFNGFVPKDYLASYFIAFNVRPVSIARLNQFLEPNLCKSLSSIYSTVLTAMQEHDYDFLSQIMERKLYNECHTGLAEIQDNGQKLEFITTSEAEDDGSGSEEEDFGSDNAADSINIMGVKLDKKRLKQLSKAPQGFTYLEKDMTIYIEPKGVFGADIDRSKNPGNTIILGNDLYSKKGYLNPKRLADLYTKQILVLNVYYFTNRRLILKEQDSDVVVEGSEAPKTYEDHKFRFESYADDIDWVLCDIDDHLYGNPYNWDKEQRWVDAMKAKRK